MRDIVASIESEYRRYRALGEGALAQVPDAALGTAPEGDGNSMAILVQHLGGNLLSRFKDFLTSDGEKPWRDREAEFSARTTDRGELLRRWDEGWKVLQGTLASLADEDLGKTVHIRGESLSVREALHRSLSHTAYHVGQMVMRGRSIAGRSWRFLSIPPGKSAEYLRAPTMEKAPLAAAVYQEGIAERILKAVHGPVWHGPALEEILRDLSASEASARPAAGRHTIAQIVGHILFWCNDTARRLPQGGVEKTGIPEPADGSDWPLPAPLDDPAWSHLRGSVTTSHRALAEAARRLSPDRLPVRVPGRTVSYEDMLRGVIEHAAYHGGQIALLRRSLREAAPA